MRTGTEQRRLGLGQPSRPQEVGRVDQTTVEVAQHPGEGFDAEQGVDLESGFGHFGPVLPGPVEVGDEAVPPRRLRVAAGDGPERCARKSEIVLNGQGRIGCGFSANDIERDLVFFELV